MGTLNRLRYIQRNIVTTNVLTNTRLVTPTPRNMSTVQVSSGRQIAVLEAETHKECRGCRIRSCWYSQSAIPMLRVPIVAATTCNVKISSIKISSLIDGAPLAPGSVGNHQRSDVGLGLPAPFSRAGWKARPRILPGERPPDSVARSAECGKPRFYASFVAILLRPLPEAFSGCGWSAATLASAAPPAAWPCPAGCENGRRCRTEIDRRLAFRPGHRAQHIGRA